jgi:hypothetical protein
MVLEVLALVSVTLTVFGFFGPPWPKEPIFDPALPSSGSPFDVTFNGTNKSSVFSLPNLSVDCTLVCFKFKGRGGSAIASLKPSSVFVTGIGPRQLKADQTLPFMCNLRGVFGADGIDAADGLPTIAIAFRSEYDNPWWLWFRRKTTQSDTFSLNTKAVPPQWVRGEIAGLCDFKD